MCGIAGVVGVGAADHSDRVRLMLESLRHRGPDGERIATFDNAVVGTARLSVIDPTGGAQPVLGHLGRTALVCNGEIYGYRRLRQRFADYPYQSQVDVEVIHAMYEKWGLDLLAHLPGTFALALWDDRSDTLLLARDRFGERPLYWASSADGLLVFGSELKALLRSGLVRVELDRGVVAEALRQGYVPAGHCIWKGIHSLGPAEQLVWRPGRPPELKRWWTPPAPGPAIERADAMRWFRAELERAVVDQLEADVPVGAFLSGGVDSSTIAALAGRHRPGLPAFAFDMPGESEVPFARQVADRHGLDLRICRPADLDLAQGLTELSRIWDEPFGDSSALPTALLARFARKDVTVALTGDGADELLGGYLCWTRGMLEPDDPARPDALAPQTGARSSWRDRFAPRLAARRAAGAGPGTGAGVAGSGSGVARRYSKFRQYFSADQLVALGLPAAGVDEVALARYQASSPDDICRFDLDHYLPGDILVKSDRASMSVGLEVRAPFLDVEVAEGCIRLPPQLKVDAQREKLLLRDSFADLLPAEVSDRPKQGFGAPMTRWLADPEVVELRRAHLSDRSAPLFDLLDFDAVQPFVDTSGQALWNLLSLALWWDEHRLVPVA